MQLVVIGANAKTASVEKFVTVQDFLLIGIGDSYGSGEGSPDIPISLSLFTQTQQAQQELATRESALADAIQDLTDAELELSLTQDEVQPALDALEAYNNECIDPFIPTFSCPGATASLIFELALLGFNEAADILVLGIAFIQDLIDGLVNTAEAAVGVASGNVGIAQAAVNDAIMLVDNLVEQLKPTWQNAQCHRSALSGQAQAAIMLEQLDPRTSVTFVHLSCSGATIVDGLIGSYQGAEPDLGPDISPQIDQIAALVGNREIDGVITSIGGNDAKFAPIIEACITQEVCHLPPTSIDVTIDALRATFCGFPGTSFYDDCVDAFGGFNHPESADVLFANGVATLPARYADLSARIQTQLSGFSAERMYLTEYPNATRDHNGNLCQLNPNFPLNTIPGFSLIETAWAETTVTRLLNLGVQTGATAHGWNYVNGIFTGFRLHGYCSFDNWFVRFQDTFRNQGNVNGVVHPTEDGYQWQAERILAFLQNDLFVGGDIGQPRPPEQAPFALTGGPYSINEGSSVLLDNNSFDPNGDTFSSQWSLAMNAPNTASLSNPNNARALLNGLDDGTGSVTLSVTDNDGTSSVSANVTITNVSPVVFPTGDTGDEGSSVTLTVSFTDPGPNDTHTASIDWGDSVSSGLSSVSSPFTVTHTYRDNGVFRVNVRVEDDDGGFDTGSTTMTIRNVAPSVSMPTVVFGSEGTQLSLPAIITDPGLDDSHSAVVDWGDGVRDVIPNVLSVLSFRHTYADNGLFNIRVVVTDDDGGEDIVNRSANISNRPPAVEVRGSVQNEGSPAQVLVSFSDPGTRDTHVAVIDWGDGNIEPLGSKTSPFIATHTYNDNGVFIVEAEIIDDDGGVGKHGDGVTILNVAPSVTVTGDTVSEGSAATVNVNFSDPGSGDTHSAIVNWGDGTSDNLGAVTSPFNANHTYTDNASYNVSVTVTDDDGGADVGAAVVTVTNAAPVVELVTGLENPFAVNEAANALVSFSDAGVLDTHSAEWDWGDGNTSAGVVTEASGLGSVSGSHSYAAAGIYTVTITVTDNDGDSGQTIHEFAVVYDPAGGFVTGNGWIDSPAGAYRPDQAAAGKAILAFVAKYHQGAQAPEGQSQFRFQTVRFVFQSDSYQWLVIGGSKATFKGTGSVDGVSGYGFLISGIDGDLKQNPTPDSFRIKVWEIASGDIVYDNGSGNDDADPSTDLGAGNIVVHKGK